MNLKDFFIYLFLIGFISVIFCKNCIDILSAMFGGK